MRAAENSWNVCKFCFNTVFGSSASLAILHSWPRSYPLRFLRLLFFLIQFDKKKLSQSAAKPPPFFLKKKNGEDGDQGRGFIRKQTRPNRTALDYKGQEGKEVVFCVRGKAAAAKTSTPPISGSPRAARAALVDKRAKDVHTYGNNNELERTFLVECEERMQARGAAADDFVILSDFALADCLSGARFLTCKCRPRPRRPRRRSNRYLFNKSAAILACSWCSGSSTSNARGSLTARGSTRERARLLFDSRQSEDRNRRRLPREEPDMDAMLTYLFESDLKPHIQLTTEDAARANLKGLKIKKNSSPSSSSSARSQERTSGRASRATCLTSCASSTTCDPQQHKSCYPKGMHAGCSAQISAKLPGQILTANG